MTALNVPPAESPATTIRSGSPPNSAMLACTHRAAASASSTCAGYRCALCPLAVDASCPSAGGVLETCVDRGGGVEQLPVHSF